MTMTDGRDKSLTTESTFVVEEEQAGNRIDVYLMSVLGNISRVKIGRLIHQQKIRVDERNIKPSYRVRSGDRIDVEIPPPEPMGSIPEDIPLSILYEDDDIVAIDKPAGMVVHPAKGNWSGTLTAALTFHFSKLSSVAGEHRPGIVHRLDRDTTGVIIVAKNDRSHMNLTRQFEKRTVEKTYIAIVSPSPDRDRDWIREPIGVHPYQREKMAIRDGHRTSRSAETFYEVIKRFRGFATVLAFPKTGRTHQIRLHLAHISCPVLCDRLYSGRSRIDASMIDRQLGVGADGSRQIILERQALHAKSITLQHPSSGDSITFEADLPVDLATTIGLLEKYRSL